MQLHRFGGSCEAELTGSASLALGRVGRVERNYPNSRRMPELDALRGLFLVWMTLTHMPTRFSEFVNQPIGFVTSAEGFVFLSALLVSRVYLREAQTDEQGLRAKLWRRSLKIYGYHLLMLAFAFTVAAAIASTAHRPALSNLLNFYLAHPVVAIVGSILLIYCPPLLDILPMYVMFLFFTPMLLTAALRYGWTRILAVSGLVWIGAQFGLRELLHNVVVHVTHLPIPLQETGAFNLFAWQGVWIGGLWLGAKSVEGAVPLSRLPGQVTAGCAAVCVFFIAVRHGWLGPYLTQESLGAALDKWNIGLLRVVNLAAFLMVCYWLRRYVVRLIAIEPFLTLGKASLQVFCAHILFVFVGLALLYEDVPQLHGMRAYGLLLLTFTGLILVAGREVRLRRAERKAAAALPKDSPAIS
jgi:hypothetical protein